MSDVGLSVLYKSCVAHLAKGPLNLLNLNALTRLFRLLINEWENFERCEEYLLESNFSIDEAKLFDQYQNLFEFVQKDHQPNGIYCRMMEHEK